MSEPFVGEIRMFGGTFAPMGWFLCDGRTLQISQYQTLFALIGNTYGGDGVNNFNLPDLRGRIPVDQGAGYTIDIREAGRYSLSEARKIAKFGDEDNSMVSEAVVKRRMRPMVRLDDLPNYLRNRRHRP